MTKSDDAPKKAKVNRKKLEELQMVNKLSAAGFNAAQIAVLLELFG